MNSRWLIAWLVAATLLNACGDDSNTDGGTDGPAADAPPPACERTFDFAVSGEGHADPLAVGAGEARAGRVLAEQLPARAGDLLTWAGGDWVLANENVAVVIEDVGPSDLYDPWGGKPVGMALMQDGAMVSPADFGELFFLVEAHALFTQTVGVLNDGSDGQAAVIRASGRLAPMPFMDGIAGLIFRNDISDIAFAIDYVLEPGAETVGVFFHYGSPRSYNYVLRTNLYGFMFTYRMPSWSPGYGFALEGEAVPWLGFIDRAGASYAYITPDTELDTGLSASGFQGRFGQQQYSIPGCEEFTRHHVDLVIGGPGLDGMVAAVARARGDATRTITGNFLDADGAPAAGARVHATDSEGGHLTEGAVGDDGSYTVTVPAGEAVSLYGYRQGDPVVGPIAVSADTATADLTMEATGTVRVRALPVDGAPDETIPARIQLLPVAGGAVPAPLGVFGEPLPQGGRLYTELSVSGDELMRVPAGRWEVIVSRGYEYEMFTTEVDVTAGVTVNVDAELQRSVPTPGVMCADFHIHTIRSNDSSDDARYKIAGALADGLEIPVRSDHEYVGDFQPLIEAMGMTEWAFGVSSVELTTMQIFGHFGVVPAVEVSDGINGGAPEWQRWPTTGNPTQEVENLTPGELFAQVRSRPEEPQLIINHPRGGTNYFDVAGYDPLTGSVDNPAMWDDSFTAVEVFNDSGWQSNRDGLVEDWLSFLNHGRRVFAVGSSDSHHLRNSPVGYPRTCLMLGTDTPSETNPNAVRDAMATGRSTISGGIYVFTTVGDAGPGMEATDQGAVATVAVSVYAASWVDVDTLEFLVDGETQHTVSIRPEDASMDEPTLRYQAEFTAPVSESGSYVIAAAYGDASLAPVHPGRTPFGVTNPIFLSR